VKGVDHVPVLLALLAGGLPGGVYDVLFMLPCPWTCWPGDRSFCRGQAGAFGLGVVTALPALESRSQRRPAGVGINEASAAIATSVRRADGAAVGVVCHLNRLWRP